MARIKPDEIMEHLSSDLRNALGDALREVAPGTNINSDILFRAFVRATDRRCRTWEKVPDRYVEADSED
jgi:hypothetical protein